MVDALALTSAGSASNSDSAAFFVSPVGRDSWSGRLAEPNSDGTDGPFASLGRARDAMRVSGLRTTYLRGGTYALAGPLELSAADNGVRFFAYPGETPILSGGQRVTGFTAESDGRYSAALGQPSGLDLFIGGQRQHVAQSGDWNPADPARSGWQIIEEAAGGASRRSIRYREGDLSLSAVQTGMRIQVFDTERLADDILEIASIDRNTRTITFRSDARSALRTGGTYRLLNDETLLRDAGEFAWRAEDNRLVVKPEDAGRLLAEGAVVPRLGTLVRLAGANNVTIQGLTFTDTLYNGRVVDVQGGGGHSIIGNRFVNVGNAIALSGSTANSVAGNVLDHLGENGIVLTGGSSGNRIEGNRITHVGEVVKYAAAVMADGARDNVIARNDIAWSSRYGISIKNWYDGNTHWGNTVEYNRILHTGLETADGGAIEVLNRSNTANNMLIRGNWIEDTGGLATDASGNWLSQAKSFGIYLDDMANNVTVRDNFIKGTGWASVFVHGGDGNLVENNFAVIRNDREEFIRLEWVPKAGDIGLLVNNTVRRNVIHAETAVDDYWELWSPGSFQIDGNLVFNAPRYGGGDRIASGGVMVDPAGGNYALRSGTSAADMGIHDLDWAAMGASFTVPSVPPPPSPDPTTPLTLVGRGGHDTLIGGAGTDWATLGDGGGTCYVSAVETLVGGSGADWVNLGDGGNSLILAAIETLVGGAGGDWVNLGNRGNTMILAAIETLVGGAGQDWINLGNRGNSMILAAVETLVGGAGQDWINLGNRGNRMILAAIETLVGGAGQDWIDLGNRGNTMILAAVETLVGGTGHDWVNLGNRGNTMVLTAVETLVGGAGQDRITLGNRGNTTAVSWVETLVGGNATDDITMQGGAVWFDGGGGADRITLQADANVDTLLFGAFDAGSPAGIAGGYDEIRQFQTGIDRVAIGGALRAGIDRNGDGQLATAQRNGGTANLVTDEVIGLANTVWSLADTDFGAFRAALGNVASDGTARSALVIASDGTNSALYVITDNGDGAIAASETRLLGLFAGTMIGRGDVILS